MSMGTFDAFTSARLGIYAAQLGLKVTGNNVSNINTEGYTRQRLDQVSFKAGAYDRYRSQQDNHVGSGALVMNINQVRDPYLDVRFRNVSAQVGYNDKMVAGLQEIADILDEVGKGENASDNEKGDGLLHAQIQDLSEKLRAYEKEPTKANNDLVRTSAEILCGMFNKYADRLEVLYQDTVKDFDDQVTKVNECLKNIRDLNREIRDCEIYGDTALELRDERNRQIDELSQYIHIKVVYTEEEIGGGQKVEKMSLYLDNDNPDTSVTTDESMLIDGIFGAQLYRTPVPNTGYDPQKTDDPDYDPDADQNKPYLDKDGKPVLELKDAALKDPDNFGLTISKLVDFNNRDWKGVTTIYGDLDAATKTAVDGLLKSITKGDTAGDPEWTVEEPAVAAVYSFDFKPSDAKWEKDQTLEIAGKVYTIVDGQTDIANGQINANDANNKATMAEKIAEALGASDKYKDKYDVTAKTEDGNTTIVFTATDENAGAIPVSQRPSIIRDAKSDPQDKLLFGDRQIVTAGKDAVLKPPEDKTTTDPNTGTETKVGYIMSGGEWKKVTTITEHTRTVELDDNDLHGALQATRELLTEKGEFTTKDTVEKIDENAAGKRGIPYYQLSLDLLARQFATQYNKLNSGYMQDQNGNAVIERQEGTLEELVASGTLAKAKDSEFYIDAAGNYVGKVDDTHNPCVLTTLKINVNDTPAEAVAKIKAADPAVTMEDGSEVTEDNLDEFLAYHCITDADKTAAKITVDAPVKMGGLLFSNRNDRDTEGTGTADDPYITAANISVAHKWSNGDVELVPTYKVLFLDENGNSMPHTTQNDNAGHMLNLIEKGLTYDPTVLVPDAVSTKLFQGNFNDMFSRMNTICGQDIRANKIELNNNYTQQVEIDTQRDGVSGVDLNDEAMNMMQFQKALNAAMRLMTVIDEALDRLINNTGIAGR